MTGRSCRSKSWMLGCALLALSPVLFAQSARLYVGNSEEDSVSVIDLASFKVIDTIKVGTKVHGMAVQADGRRLFTSIESNNTLRVIDTATDHIIATIPLTGRPNQCAVTPDGRFVAVPIRDKGAVDIVDVAQQKVAKTLPVSKPHNAFSAGNNQFLYVSSMGDNEVELIDLRKMDYAARIPVGGVPRPYVVSSDGNMMYVAESNLHGFVKVDVARKAVLSRVAMPAENPKPHPRPFEPIDTLTHGLGLTPDGKELWVTSLLDNSLYVYDVKANKIVGRVQVGDGPNWVAFSPDGKYVCVSNADSNDVSIIDVKTRRELARVKVGKIPKRLVAANVPRS